MLYQWRGQGRYRRVLRRGRDLLQIVEPASLLGIRIRDEQRGEELAEHRAFLPPPLKNQRGQGLSTRYVCRVLMAPPLCVSAIKNKVTDTLRIACRILDSDGAAPARRQEWKTIKPSRVDDAGEIGRFVIADLGPAVGKDLIDQMNAWHSRDKTQLDVDDYSRTIRGMHVYDSIVVFDKDRVGKPEHQKTGQRSF